MLEDRPFAPITRDTVSAQIRAQMLQRITTGDMPPGSRIPSERELSESFSVARTSVREAMQVLLSMGVIERRGNRSFVAEQLPEVMVSTGEERRTFVTELFETRRVLEVPIFVLAAQHADDAARVQIADVAAQFVRGLDIQQFRQLDRLFHTTIASACGNSLLIELYSKVLDRLFRSADFEELLGAERNRAEVERIVEEASDAHRRIATAIGAHDIDGVRRAAETHLDEVERSLVDDLM